MKTPKAKILLGVACLGLLGGVAAVTGRSARAFDQGGQIEIVADTIGGVVTSKHGPEAGVWVIAETHDLAQRYVKIVVTDDQGRYVLPELPNATYKVWVRGYGLVDSKPVEAKPGQRLDLAAVIAPDERAAAQYYPASYWYAMLQPPAQTEFSGPNRNGAIPEVMLTNQHFVEQLKEKCLFCHQVGDAATRTPADPDNTVAAWDTRLRRWPQMHTESRRLGDRGLQMLAQWTGAIAAGQTPLLKPQRPSGVERNLVLTVIGWGDGVRLHDQTSSDRLAPTTNAGGPIYGMNTGEGAIEVLDPKTLQRTTLQVPPTEGGAPSDRAAVHASEMDDKGRVWIATVNTSSAAAPTWCSDGSTLFSKYYPLKGAAYAKAAQLPVYDPKTRKVLNLAICAGGNHGHFSWDEEQKFYLTHDTNVITWFDTKVWDQTHDVRKATGWCPMVLDTSGDGKIDPRRENWVQPPADALKGVQGEYGGALTAAQLKKLMAAKAVPGKDLRISRYLYGLSVAPDGSVWAAAYVPYVPSGVVHLIPGANPPLTCKTEYYEPPMRDGQYVAVGARGVGTDLLGRAWVAFSSGQIGIFDRRRCKVTAGPTATGQQCPEGWTMRDLPAPPVGSTFARSDMAYNEWPDSSDVMGLGKDTHFFPLVNSDSIVAMREGSSDFLTFRVPYPMGFYTRGLDFRLQDPNAGWKGRAFYATESTAVLTHQEGGMDAPGAQEFIFKIRPNPLAH